MSLLKQLNWWFGTNWRHEYSTRKATDNGNGGFLVSITEHWCNRKTGERRTVSKQRHELRRP